MASFPWGGTMAAWIGELRKECLSDGWEDTTKIQLVLKVLLLTIAFYSMLVDGYK
jgi:hypothetical protein